MKKLFGLLFIIIVINGSLFSQMDEKTKKEFFNNGLFFYEMKEYREALYNFMQLYYEDTSNANLNYKIAMCYFNIPGQEIKSIPYLKRAARDISVDYREYAYNHEPAPLHTLFFLGKSYRLAGELDKALEVIDKFTNSPYYTYYNSDIVDREIQICKRAKILKDKPVEFELENLGKPINNQANNSYPVISYDGKTIVYITTLKLYDAVFYSKKVNNKWTEPVNISSDIGSDGNFIPTSLNNDGTELYLIRKNKDGFDDIYKSNLVEGKWAKVTPLDDINNRFSNESHACISEDGKMLLFSSDKKGEGELDLFYSMKEEDGEWSRPKNMGKTINSEYNENTPFLANNGNLLIFSSENHYNIGEYDIFYSVKEPNGKWSKPHNIGYPLNTTRKNTFYVPSEDGSSFYVSRQEPGGFGGNDIYKIKLKSGLFSFYSNESIKFFLATIIQ